MSKKDRKRRETARRQKEQRRAKAAAASEDVEEGVEEDDDSAPDDQASTIRRRAEQKREFGKRKRAKARAGQTPAAYFWGGGIAVAALAVLGGFLFLGGGGGDDGPNSTPIVTPDARVAGLPIDVTFTVDADDNGQNVNPRFLPNTISAEAGQVIEIFMPNVGSVAHNLRLAGLDGEYDTRDDWLVDPGTVQPGETGRVVVTFDEPGTYPFKCDFHPTQTGILTLR